MVYVLQILLDLIILTTNGTLWNLKPRLHTLYMFLWRKTWFTCLKKKLHAAWISVSVVIEFICRKKDSMFQNDCYSIYLLFKSEWWIMLLIIMYALNNGTFFLHFRGYLGPGGQHENYAHWNCTGGAAGAIDRWVFGDAHIYQHPTCKVTHL